MIATYRFQLDEPDRLHVTIEAGKAVPIDKLVEAVKRIAASKRHLGQDEITVALADQFGARVVTVSWQHSRTIHVEIEA